MSKNNCANCNCSLYMAKADGVSGLLNPGPKWFRLCEPCWIEEEDLVDELGTNVMPDRVARYTANQPEGAN